MLEWDAERLERSSATIHKIIAPHIAKDKIQYILKEALHSVEYISDWRENKNVKYKSQKDQLYADSADIIKAFKSFATSKEFANFKETARKFHEENE